MKFALIKISSATEKLGIYRLKFENKSNVWKPEKLLTNKGIVVWEPQNRNLESLPTLRGLEVRPKRPRGG
jgi:hypothetical protein